MLISNYERIYYTTVNRIANIIVSKLISLHDHRVPRLMTFRKMMTCLVLYRVALKIAYFDLGFVSCFCRQKII